MNKSQLIHEKINWLYGLIFSVFSAKNGLPLPTIQNRLYATAGAALVANWLHKNGIFILIFVHWLIAQPQICQKPLFYGVFRRFLRLFKIILCNTVLQHFTSGPYSHSIVAGGFPVISYTTLPTPLTSFTILDETLPRSLCESGAYSQVIKSVVLTARSATV